VSVVIAAHQRPKSFFRKAIAGVASLFGEERS
jgi:hypothetical protein